MCNVLHIYACKQMKVLKQTIKFVTKQKCFVNQQVNLDQPLRRNATIVALIVVNKIIFKCVLKPFTQTAVFPL